MKKDPGSSKWLPGSFSLLCKGYTTRDIRGGPSNNEQDIAAFLKKRGAILHYAVA